MKTSDWMKTVLNLFTPRRIKRTSISIVGLAACFVLWSFRSTSDHSSSAITCKSKIAQIVIPRQKERDAYLSSLAHDAFTLENEYFNFVTTLTRNCWSQVHYGPSEDGGWEMCLDPQFDIKPPCLVYSFGIGHDFRFEKAVEENLKCEVHAFDPSMGVASHQYSERGFFHDVGIDSEDTSAMRGKWKMKKLQSIMKDLGHEGRTIDYLKMDVEFSEWPALQNILKTKRDQNIRQMALEVHTPEMDIHHRPDHLCTWTTPEAQAFMLKTLIDLRNAGFSLYYSRTNYRTQFVSSLTGHTRQCCHNLHFVNTKHPGNQNRAHLGI